MPNAQTHMASVWELLNRPPIQAAFSWLSAPEVQSAFLFGAISPDARIVSGHDRTETHFFDIPIHNGQFSPDVFLRTWPVLRDPGQVDPRRAAFVAGYMTHLIMDQVWVERIVMEGLFIEGLSWGIAHPNWRTYSLLMTYMEYHAAEKLPRIVIERLALVPPGNWLPFLEDTHLLAWREHVLSHIGAGGARRISTMFAYSLGLTPLQLESIVLSDERMAEEVFDVIPRERLEEFRNETLQRSYDVVVGYLSSLNLPG